VAKAAKSQHVVPAIGGGWSVLNEGATRAVEHFPTKDAADSWARAQSIKGRTNLVIHRRDGTIAEKSSYGNDPHPPRDRNGK
jgi:hypothetical protein